MLLIIGGGIGGMTTALAVAQAGLDVHLVEQAPEFGEIGAGIQLAPNAMRVLDRLGLVPALDEVCVRPRNVVFMHADTGKIRLIAVGFGEAATAVNNIAVRLRPGEELFPGHSTEMDVSWPM